VAILGEVPTADLDSYRELFPTVWSAPDIDELEQLIEHPELDLLIIYRGADGARQWPGRMHVICFSASVDALPGPISESSIRLGPAADTEEHLLPSIPLQLARRRERDLSETQSVMGWELMNLAFSSTLRLLPDGDERERSAREAFMSGALIRDHHTKLPLAVMLTRTDNHLGVAWLPYPPFSPVPWVELICGQWAESDCEAFPDFGDWRKRREWMVPEEIELVEQIDVLETQKLVTVQRMNADIEALEDSLTVASTQANTGLRRLITAQGDELVQAVSGALVELGFAVESMDENIAPGHPKKEDLRITHEASAEGGWTAIVEVRGYSRSGGKTADFMRLARFAELFAKEKGKAPSKLIYVVNGPIDLAPHLRPAPFEPTNEDLEVFAEAGGLVVPTQLLFQALKGCSTLDLSALADSLMSSVGCWNPVLVQEEAVD